MSGDTFGPFWSETAPYLEEARRRLIARLEDLELDEDYVAGLEARAAGGHEEHGGDIIGFSAPRCRGEREEEVADSLIYEARALFVESVDSGAGKP